MSDWKPDREEAEFIGRCMAIDHGIAEIVTDQLRRGVPLRNVRATLEDALRITRMVRGQTTPPKGAREERVMEKKPAKSDSKVYRQTFYGILNAQGDFWTPLAFDNEVRAREHIIGFWRNDPEKRDECLRRFKIVPVRIRLDELTPEPANAD